MATPTAAREDVGRRKGKSVVGVRVWPQEGGPGPVGSSSSGPWFCPRSSLFKFVRSVL